MEHLPLEDLFSSVEEKDSPAARLYLYRMLHLLSNRGAFLHKDPPISYQGARKLASRLGLDSPERLSRLFKDLGLGTLRLEIGSGHIQASLVPETAPGKAFSSDRGCELERGILDGALEIITGIPVTTVESKCWTRGDPACIFEAQRDDYSQRFVPLSVSGGSSGALGDGRASAVKLSNASLKSWFMDLAARELARTKRHGRSLSVIYVDLDDLGQINATHGRSAGDQVISAVSAALSKSCRTEDFLWHNDEDEFAIVLSETSAEKAEVVARRLSMEILSAAEYLDVPATVSASIGFSTFPTHADSLAGLFEGARAAVYRAKSRGKGKAQVTGRHRESAYEFTKDTSDAAAGAAGDSAGERLGSQTSGGKSEFAGAESAESSRAGRPGERTGSGGRLEAGEERKDDHLDSAVGEGSSGRSVSLEPGSSALRSSAEHGMNSGRHPARLIIALSSPLLIAGMREVLSSDEKITIVQEITNPTRLASVVSDERPDLIFTDLQTILVNDHETLTLLRQDNLPCKCIVFINEVDQDIIRLAADFEIDGIILQSSTARETTEALHTIYSGRTVMPPEIQSAIGELESNRRLLGELSDREIEVLRLVAEGKSNAQISEDLFITVNTVRFHLANIYQKLSVSNRTEAANYFLRQDLAAPDGQTKLL